MSAVKARAPRVSVQDAANSLVSLVELERIREARAELAALTACPCCSSVRALADGRCALCGLGRV